MFSNKQLQENVIQRFQMKGTRILLVHLHGLVGLKKLSFNNDKQLKIDGFDLLIYN